MKSKLSHPNSNNKNDNLNFYSNDNKHEISNNKNPTKKINDNNLFFDKKEVKVKYLNSKSITITQLPNNESIMDEKNYDKDIDKSKINDLYNPWENTVDILKLNNDSKYLINELELKGITSFVKNSDIKDCVSKFKNINLRSALNPSYKIKLEKIKNNEIKDDNQAKEQEDCLIEPSFFPKVNCKNFDFIKIDNLNTSNLYSIHNFYVIEKVNILIEIFYNELSSLEEYYQQNKYSSILCKKKDYFDSDNISKVTEYINLLNQNEHKLSSLINNTHLTYNTHIDIKYESHMKFLQMVKQLILRSNMLYLDELKDLNMRWMEEMISDTKDLVQKLTVKNNKKVQLIELDNIIT